MESEFPNTETPSRQILLSIKIEMVMVLETTQMDSLLMLALTRQEHQIWVVELVVLTRMVMVGQMSMMHSPMSQVNIPIWMVMAMGIVCPAFLVITVRKPHLKKSHL